jgi:hypothetical protein
MRNLHSKLEQYMTKCDEIFLSKHLQNLIKEVYQEVEQIEVSDL